MHGVYPVSQSAHTDGNPVIGLGTFYPPHVSGNPLQSMTDNGLRDAFWLQLLQVNGETSVSCLIVTTVQLNVHIRFPYPLPQHSLIDLFNQLGGLCRPLVRVGLWPCAECLTTASHLVITCDARAVEVSPFRDWFRFFIETRHFERCRSNEGRIYLKKINSTFFVILTNFVVY
jgi:hypothetical protein